MHALQVVAIVQGAYFAATGLWPLLHVHSFMAVTGPKTDVWLVRTVGVIVLCVGVCVGLAGWQARITPEIALLAITSAAALAAVDIIYVLRRVIDKIYLTDAVAEIVLIAVWTWSLLRTRA